MDAHMSMKDQRRQEIVQLIDTKGSISFREIRDRFPTLSEVTLRGDLKQLDANHLIVRTYGGARSIRYAIGVDIPINQRIARSAAAKRAIAAKVRSLVSGNGTIFLDSGSTTTALARVLPDARYTVFTPSLSCANELASLQKVTTIMPGGTLNEESMCLEGSRAIDGISDMRFEQMFLGATAYAEGGFTCELDEQAHLKRAAMARSEEIILLMDSSKIERRGTFMICDIPDLDIVVSDGGLPQDFLKACARANVEVI